MNRDPHLPPPEVCDWLLERDWSDVRVVDQRVTSMAGRLLESGTLIGSSLTLVAIGADETGHFELPVEALEVLRADQRARQEAVEQKRAAMEPDELEGERQRDEARVDEAGGPDPDQPLPRGGIVLNGEDTGFLLLEAIVTLREIANPEQGGANGLSWCRGKARAMLDRVQQVGEAQS
jgi:hypothetical protein